MRQHIRHLANIHLEVVADHVAADCSKLFGTIRPL